MASVIIVDVQDGVVAGAPVALPAGADVADYYPAEDAARMVVITATQAKKVQSGWLYVEGQFSPPPDATPPADRKARTYKSEIWRRATEDEAAVIDAGLTEAPVKDRRLWDDSQVLMHEASEFATIRAVMVASFGEARADELLAPSYWEV
jgi:hypothetical protein